MSACLSMQATEPLQLFVVLFVVFELSMVDRAMAVPIKNLLRCTSLFTVVEK